MRTRYKVGVTVLVVAGVGLFWMQSRNTPADVYPPGGVTSSTPMPNLPRHR